jgi:membrane protein implicated in regulation of membrane protease activity
MGDPRFLVTFAVVFLLLGLYNVFAGYRRLRRAQAQGLPARWYKQTLLLIGLEYILLSFVFLFRIAVMNGWIPVSLNAFILPFYLVILIPSAVLAGLIVRQGIVSLRQSRQGSARPAPVTGQRVVVTDDEKDEVSRQRHAIQQQHRRERRQKAAAARRRRAGRV